MWYNIAIIPYCLLESWYTLTVYLSTIVIFDFDAPPPPVFNIENFIKSIIVAILFLILTILRTKKKWDKKNMKINKELLLEEILILIAPIALWLVPVIVLTIIDKIHETFFLIISL